MSLLLQDNTILVNFSYILSSMFFIFGLKMLGSPETARRGNLLSSTGMFLAVIVTLLDQSILDFTWIIVGVLIGASIGFFASTLIKMTAMPEMVALFNGFGGIASLLVGSSEYLTGFNVNPATFVSIYTKSISDSSLNLYSGFHSRGIFCNSNRRSRYASSYCTFE